MTMSRINWMCIALFVFAALAPAETTPMDTELPEGKVTEIACEHKGETYHYCVYIPEGYQEKDNSKREYPCLFIASPGGNAKMWEAKDWLIKRRWLAIMLVESKNGPWEPIISNFTAAFNDASKRLRINRHMRFGTGFSGGARAAGAFAGKKKNLFAGVIYQGALGTQPAPRKSRHRGFYFLCGDRDGNRGELISARKEIGRNPFAYEIFPGNHQWAPAKYLERALRWVMMNAYLNNPKNKIPLEEAGEFIDHNLAEIEGLDSLIEKYELLNKLKKIVTKQGISRNKKFKEQTDSINAMLTEIKKNKELRREKQAKVAFFKAMTIEISSKSKQIGTNAKKKMFRLIAKKFDGTEYGQRAQEHLDSMQKTD